MILLYFVKEDDTNLNMVLKGLRENKISRNNQIIEKLNGLGLEIDMEDLKGHGDQVLGRPHIAELMVKNKYVQKIREELNNQNVKSSNFPIEHRIYPINSKGMEWHIDTLMYDIPQYEAVFTIRNNSRSYTEWEDNNGKIHRKWTKPNSILILRAK